MAIVAGLSGLGMGCLAAHIKMGRGRGKDGRGGAWPGFSTLPLSAPTRPPEALCSKSPPELLSSPQRAFLGVGTNQARCERTKKAHGWLRN